MPDFNIGGLNSESHTGSSPSNIRIEHEETRVQQAHLLDFPLDLLCHIFQFEQDNIWDMAKLCCVSTSFKPMLNEDVRDQLKVGATIVISHRSPDWDVYSRGRKASVSPNEVESLIAKLSLKHTSVIIKMIPCMNLSFFGQQFFSNLAYISRFGVICFRRGRDRDPKSSWKDILKILTPPWDAKVLEISSDCRDVNVMDMMPNLKTVRLSTWRQSYRIRGTVDKMSSGFGFKTCTLSHVGSAARIDRYVGHRLDQIESLRIHEWSMDAPVFGYVAGKKSLRHLSVEIFQLPFEREIVRFDAIYLLKDDGARHEAVVTAVQGNQLCAYETGQIVTWHNRNSDRIVGEWMKDPKLRVGFYTATFSEQYQRLFEWIRGFPNLESVTIILHPKLIQIGMSQNEFKQVMMQRLPRLAEQMDVVF